MKKKNIISLLLVAAMAVCGSVPGLVHATTDASGNSTEEVTTQEVNDAATKTVNVNAEVASEFSVIVPKSITLNGATKSAAYKVSCSGDFPANKKVTVMPDASFLLSSVNKNNVTATISQDKTEWLYDDNAEGTGTITADGISAGTWNGVFDFNIAFEDKECNENEHDWEYQTGMVDEEVFVEAWDEPVEVTESAYVCNQCGKVFGKSEYGSQDDAVDALLIHQFEDSSTCYNYRTEKVTYTYYIHHDPETKTETVQKNVSRTCRKCQKFEDLTK